MQLDPEQKDTWSHVRDPEAYAAAIRWGRNWRTKLERHKARKARQEAAGRAYGARMLAEAHAEAQQAHEAWLATQDDQEAA